MEYVITDAREAFRNRRTPFTDTIRRINQAAEQRAMRKLTDLSPGGVVPGSGEWGTVTLRPRYFNQQGEAPSGTQITAGSFRQSTPSSTGWANALSADLSSGGSNIGADWVLGVAGFLLLEPTLRYSELRLSTSSGDKTLPVINLEEAQMFDQAAVLLKLEDDDDIDHFIFDQDNDFVLEANYTSATGSYHLKPLGVGKVPQSIAIQQSP